MPLPATVRRAPWKVQIAGILLLPLVAASALNYKGFCLAELRYVSDDEEIRAVVDHLATGDRRHWYRIGPEPGDWQSVRIDRPEIVDDFLAANPDCCRIVPGGGDVRRPTFLGRVLGQVSAVVEIDYVRHFVDGDGAVQPQPVRGYSYVSPCGTVVDDFLP